MMPKVKVQKPVYIILYKEIDMSDENYTTQYNCFHCGQYTVSWDSDFSLEEFYGHGEGLVHVCHCNTCGAEVYYVLEEKDD